MTAIYTLLFFLTTLPCLWAWSARSPYASRLSCSALAMSSSPSITPPAPWLLRSSRQAIASLAVVASLGMFGPAVQALNDDLVQVPLYTQRSSDVQTFSDISRGFKLLRPFGFNQFDGVGTGYAVKFSSLFDVDENVVVGSVAAAADKDSIASYGSLEAVGEKLAKKRGGEIVSARKRETNGVVFYDFLFSNPINEELPRPGQRNDKPTRQIELYSLCVNRGQLWSVQATSNDKLFPKHEKTLRAAVDSFFPRL